MLDWEGGDGGGWLGECACDERLVEGEAERAKVRQGVRVRGLGGGGVVMR